MRLLIAFDDTDDLSSPGTGHILEDFRTLAEENFWGSTRRITRHQLYVHPDVPYTSHNSSMCFEIETDRNRMDEIEIEAIRFIKARSAEGSDPGLCLLDKSKIDDPLMLTNFGQRAKREILNKQEAYRTAGICGARLSEHGGTGDGIIGALAAVALRHEGNDGRFRGQLENLEIGKKYSRESLAAHEGIDRIAILTPKQDITEMIDKEQSDLEIYLQDKPKTICFHGEAYFLIYNGENKDGFKNWTREELKRF